MKKNIFLLVSILFASISYANVNVVVSIVPQKTFVEKIGGDKVNVVAMVKPGSDPHTYEPKPAQMVAITKADIYFPIKIEFEEAWLDKFKAQNTKMKFVSMTDGIKYMAMPSHGESIGDDESDHNEELPFEWAGVFELKKGEYTWSFDKVSGKYADPKMKFLMIEAKSSQNDVIEAYEKEAIELFESNTKVIHDNESVSKEKITYELEFDQNKNQTIYKIKINEDGKYIFFTEHMPFEFEGKEHFFKDLNKNDIEPIAQHPGENAHHHHHHHHGENDPHVWVSPSNVKIMAKNIYEALAKEDPKNQDYYKKNYEKFITEIKNTDKEIKKTLFDIETGSKFLVFHPSWGYFAKDYGLTQLAIEVEGKEPKPKALRKIIDIAKKENIKAVFTQHEFSDKSAKALASELKIKVIKETPLAANWSQNLIKMANAIANTNSN